jgi:hypothetical protein
MTALMALLALVVGCKSDDTDTDVVDLDGDGFADGVDCDDSDPTVNPAAAEICDGIDQNCNGTIDDGLRVTYYDDSDSDGFGDPDDSVDECSRPAGYVVDNTDCDDTRNDVNPVAQELCDAIDHDCDGSNTEGAIGNANFYLDTDGDGFGDPDELERACDAPAGYVSNPDEDNDTVNNNGFDCDDGDPAVNPAAIEQCSTPYDDNCNGVANGDEPLADGMDFAVDADGDGFGHPTVVQQACGAGIPFDIDGDNIPDFVTVDNNLDCNDSDDTVNPNAPEVCDGQDNDCDPTTDENEVGQDTLTWWLDTDGDGAGIDTMAVNSCSQPSGYAPTGVGVDCDDTNPDISPLSAEFCGDSIDNDCDTLVDDSSAVDAATWFDDPDSDGFGTPGGTELVRCEQPSGYADNDFDCAPLNPDVGAPDPQYLDADGDGFGDPLVSEISCDPITGYVDNDLDCDDNEISLNPNTTWYLDGDGDGFGVDGTTVNQCLQPSGYTGASGDCDDSNVDTNPDAADLCDGEDNDCDGMVDEDCTIEWCGLLPDDTVWEAGFIHRVTCDVTVSGNGGPVLTIQPGAVVHFDDASQLRIGPAGAGTIIADGATFRHSNRVTPGTWSGIEIGPNADGAAVSSISNSTFEDVSGTALLIDDVEVALDNVSITGTNGPAITLEGDAVLEMTDSVLQNNLGPGIESEPGARLAVDGFADNVITANTGEPILISAASIGELDNNNTYSGNSIPFIGLLAGTITTSETMALLDADYRVDGNITVQGGGAPVLTIADGVLVEFSANTSLAAGLTARGAIDIAGAGFGVTFRGTQAVEGHWNSLRYGSEATASTITNLTVSDGGGEGFGNVRIEGDATLPEDERVLFTIDGLDSSFSDEDGLYARRVKLDLQNSTFEDNLGDGFALLDLTFNESNVAGNTSQNNAGSGVRVSPELVELLLGNTYSGNTFPLQVVAGTVPRSATWQPLAEDYYITGEVRVEDVDAPILTLDPGATLYFESQGQLLVGVGDQGSLLSLGTAALPVTMDPITEYQGNPSARGSYDGVVLGANQRQSLFEHTIIRYAGRQGTQGALYITGVHPNFVELDNVTLQFSGSHGLVVENGAQVYVHDSEFLDNDDIGVFLIDDRSFADLGVTPPSFTNNLIDGSGLDPINLGITDTSELAADNVITANNNIVQATQDARIAVTASDMTRSTTWFDFGIPYALDGSVEVGAPSRPVWTIEAGVEVRMTPGEDIEILVGRNEQPAGILIQGTPAEPVLFTSAAATPLRGDWAKLELGENCDAENQLCRIDHAIIEYGGSQSDEGALSVVFREYPVNDTAPVIIQNTIVRESASNGLMLAYYDGIQVPTPEVGLFAPLFCEDLDYDNVCDNAPLAGSDSSFLAGFIGVGFNHCYDPVNQTHGLSNLFCDNTGRNMYARNFQNPFLPLECENARDMDDDGLIATFGVPYTSPVYPWLDPALAPTTISDIPQNTFTDGPNACP